MKYKIIIIAALVLFAAVSCNNRLRPILYEINGENRLHLSHNETYYQIGHELNHRHDLRPLRDGDMIVLTTIQNAVHPEQSEVATGLITAIGEIEYRLYAAIPFINEGDSLDIAGNSICRLIGFYETADSLKHYECREGYIKIDSVRSSRFHAFLSGKYFNLRNDSLLFDGDLNVRLRK